MQKTVLCYGDSNTWGCQPLDGKNPGKLPLRYDENIRWPRLLQKKLGSGFYVVEEGLNGRTTNLDYHVPPDRNGKTALPVCLYSHAPIDLVILTLGGNDLKIYFGRTPEAIRDGMAELIDMVQSSSYGPDMQSPPKVLLAIQGPPMPVAEQIPDENGILLFRDSISRAKKLAELYQALAIKKQCGVIDLTDIPPSPIDGLHLDETGHKKVAERLASRLPEVI